MSAPREIVELVEGFGRRINEYRSSQYNETELRDEFVNPFFAALGWDVHNKQGQYSRKSGPATHPRFCLRLLPGAPEQRADRWARKIHARAAQASLPIFKANGSEWLLTTTERKRILQSNIFGVDIDPQAVRVTKLSLLFKVLEGERTQALLAKLRGGACLWASTCMARSTG